MQFISDRESLAEQFIYQTQKQPSYLLSSRASRRKIVYEQSLDPAEQQIQDFKTQIEQKYAESITNKIYTFPIDYHSIDMFDDTQFKQLQGDVQINLHKQQVNQASKNNFKISNKKIKNEKVNNILTHIKLLKQNMMSLSLYNEQSICESNETKPTSKISQKKTKNAQKLGRTKITFQTLMDDEQQVKNPQRRLNTEPYQKPLGFIVKKR